MPTEPRTRPTDVPVADFIAAVDHPVRRVDAEWTAAMLTEITGEAPVMWGPSIVGYGSYRGPTGDWPLIGFSPRKAQLARLGKHKTGGSCLYVNKLADVDRDVLRAMCVEAVAHMRAKYPA